MKGEEKKGEAEDDIDYIDEQVTCMTLSKREPVKRGGEHSGEKYGLWRREQKTRAARLEKQLRVLEGQIDEQLNRFQAHYNRAMVRIKLKDVAQLLMPKGAPAHELAILSWLGDWRPSAILLIHDLRIEEAVIDEEMAEIQATCILHLPFGPVNSQTGGPALSWIQSEFKKIHGVIIKAQNLRFKALELVVKKVLSQTDAAEFLVAFAGIQDLIHQFSTHHKLQKGPVSMPRKALGYT
ncbi:unnamed protein product [Ilex paraguariensis]|uniref:DOG1 domain-containing protein n=1 Tax=Ilex paraguariensis TaxID=185542 RepID=A0ABC8UX16_9AQUA